MNGKPYQLPTQPTNYIKNLKQSNQNLHLYKTQLIKFDYLANKFSKSNKELIACLEKLN
jgi:hypothetical protein